MVTVDLMEASMSRSRLIVLLLFAIILAIPIVTLVSMMAVFPILFFGYIAAVTNFGPIALLATAGINRIGLKLNLEKLADMWMGCAILWVGCAYGLSHWGDVGGSLGARNEPYLKMLFFPYVLLYGYLAN